LALYAATASAEVPLSETFDATLPPSFQLQSPFPGINTFQPQPMPWPPPQALPQASFRPQQHGQNADNGPLGSGNVRCRREQTGTMCSVRITTLPNAQFQNESNWCWAASMSMIFEAHGFAISQERIVAETMGAIINIPAGPYQIANSLNRTWTDDSGKRFMSNAFVSPVSFPTVESDLMANSPLIIGTHNHAMVVTNIVYMLNMFGKNYQVVGANDPALGMTRTLTNQELHDMSFVAQVVISENPSYLPDP
jgi:hypothetical protein